MADRLNATVEHIEDAGRGFHREALHLAEFRHLASPPTPRVDDAALGSALARLSEAFGIGHQALTALVTRHGHNLQAAAGDYRNQDIDTRGIFADLMGKAAK
ncbi:DUF6317 family protein [Streptomyces sp. CA-181903]|uniref:DUF6317 family protein n=1 Tax=Streptomyces sp. CA-181903 TaxID=3240055 RepID=UPI003D946CFC